uniref:Reverse transcriptase domain-containing protein n=1 Tax=Tanacetum cinerariifolium TaxID=118510 RepID=A0A6L2KKI3_TANCI|nr:hypothetical protein [Tanacetum cinerariifolium]
MPPEDDVLLAEEQPLPTAVSPIADSPGYITESDLGEDPKEEDDKDPKEDLADYPTHGDEEKVEEHLAPVDSILPPAYHTTIRMTPPLLPISVPTSSPPLLLPFTDYRADVLGVTLPPQKRLCIAIGPKFEVKECLSAPTARPTRGFKADYGFVGTLDAEIRRDPDRKIDFVTTVRQDTDEIYGILNDVKDDRLLMSDQLNSLRRYRRSHACTARLMNSEARASRKAWVQSIDASNTARSEVRVLQTMVLAQQIEIGNLRAADRRRQTQLAVALTLLM